MSWSIPTQNWKKQRSCKGLLREIICMSGLPRTFQSDNGPAFTAAVIMAVGAQLYKLAGPYIFRGNHSPQQKQNDGTKCSKRPWPNCAGEPVRPGPDQGSAYQLSRPGLGQCLRECICPFELIYGRPFLDSPQILGCLNPFIEQAVKHIIQLGKVTENLNKYANLILPIPKDTKLHPYDAENWVYLKTWNRGPCKISWAQYGQVLIWC